MSIEYTDKYAGADIKEIATAIKELEAERKIFKDKAALLFWEIEYLKKTLGPEVMGDQTIAKFENFPFRIQKQNDVYVKWANSDKTDGEDWLFNNGGDALIKQTINASALKKWVKDRIAAGETPPPTEHFEVEPYDYIVVVKA